MMQVLINSHQIETASVSFQEWVTAAVVNELDRFDDFLTRVEVHVSDENAHKSGARDKRCQIEMRPRGHQPLSVTNHDESLELAVNVAVVTVMLLFPVAVALAVPPVPTTPVPAAPGSVVKPAATSKEMISGTIDATLPPRPIT